MIVPRAHGTQLTVDKVGTASKEQEIEFYDSMSKSDIKKESKKRYAELRDKAKAGELKQDYELKVGAEEAIVAEENSRKVNIKLEGTIGASPGIAAVDDPSFSGQWNHSRYVGNIPESADLFLKQLGQYQTVFDNGNTKRKVYPVTIGIQAEDGTRKTMISHSRGRRIENLDVYNMVSMCKVLSNGGGLGYLMQGTNKGTVSEQEEVINKLREAIPDGLLLYMTTNDLKAETKENVINIVKLLYKADVISFNDSEARTIHRVITGDKRPNVELGYILRTMDENVAKYLNISKTSQIKFIHKETGEVAKKTGAFENMRDETLEEIMMNAAIGTAGEIMFGGYLSNTNLKGLYATFNEFQETGFEKDFGDCKGLVKVIAPKIPFIEGNTVGAGAKLDAKKHYMIAQEFQNYI